MFRNSKKISIIYFYALQWSADSADNADNAEFIHMGRTNQ